MLSRNLLLMLRFFVVLLLTLTLLLACRGDRSLPTITNWEPGSSLSVETIKSTEPFIWWEAEQPTTTNFPASDRHPFAPANPTEAAILSENKWIGVEGKRSNALFLEYQVRVPTGGDYFFYARKFWQHGAFRWRWDAQPWQVVGTQVYLMDNAPMRQLVTVNWVSLGKVKLASGVHSLRVELTQKDGAAAFDCFALTRSPLQARGKLKPDQRYTAKIPDGFLFQPGGDPLMPSPIDLRGLNELIAGENGFIQVRGEEFVHAKTDKPERFWAVNIGEQSLFMDATSMATTARFLARQGVNLVRIHAPFWSESLKPSPEKRDRLFALVAALKQQGIYTSLSIYFPVWLKMQAAYGFPGYTGQQPFSLLFFNPEFQTLYYNWWRSLLTTPNPYTGQALRDDPAVAMVELVNEDSYFFWTFQPYKTIPAPQMALLETQFGRWLNTRYGSIAAATNAWSNPKPIPGDAPTTGRMGILPLSDLFSQTNSRRSQDTAAFLASSQQQFFEQAIAYLRRDLDYKGLIYASNWITANPQILGPLDKYTNTVADFIDRHGYFVGTHEGAAAAYSLAAGQTYQDRSALLFQSPKSEKDLDFDLPIMDVRYNGKPSTITEINWSLPNRFRADFPLLAAAYGSLQGTDGFFFFATDSTTWQSTLTKFAIATPAILGQFPAAALIYRKGMIQPGQPVVDVTLNTGEVFNLKGAPITAPQNLDEFRAKDIPPGQSLITASNKSIDPLAFLVGKVNVQFSDGDPFSKQIELSQFIDRQQQTIRSSTGELLWNYQRGLVTVNAPQAQGATGFLRSAGKMKLDTLQLDSEMDYGTILLVALDDQPLATSHRMLLQVMSEEQTVGWKTSGSPRKTIQSIGSAAIAVRTLSGLVRLDRPDAASLTVTPLDHNGSPTSKSGSAGAIALQPETFHYLIEQHS